MGQTEKGQGKDKQGERVASFSEGSRVGKGRGRVGGWVRESWKGVLGGE